MRLHGRGFIAKPGGYLIAGEAFVYKLQNPNLRIRQVTPAGFLKADRVGWLVGWLSYSFMKVQFCLSSW